MYSSGCGRRGPSVPRRYYALLLATADFSTVRSTVRKNINYKDYPNNWVRKYCEQKDYTNKREYTCWLMHWEIYQVYLQETTVGCELFQVKLIMLYFSLVSKIVKKNYYEFSLQRSEFYIVYRCFFHQFFILKLRGLVVLDSVQVWRPHLPLSNSSFNPGSQNLGNIAAPPMMRIFYQLF